eukprot:GILI01044845.1.p1 GENE.GILI01044845.1~~GILI01044845.1.p1  ORF type:complete len:131 (-),score=17.49 GILI01044845.1:33-425(-)
MSFSDENFVKVLMAMQKCTSNARLTAEQQSFVRLCIAEGKHKKVIVRDFFDKFERLITEDTINRYKKNSLKTDAKSVEVASVTDTKATETANESSTKSDEPDAKRSRKEQPALSPEIKTEILKLLAVPLA